MGENIHVSRNNRFTKKSKKAMTAIQEIWIKLYLHRNDTDPSELKIKNFEGDIYDLKEKIKEKKPNDLKDVDSDKLDVYPPGTLLANIETTDPLPLSSVPPENTNVFNPLIVIPRERSPRQTEVGDVHHHGHLPPRTPQSNHFPNLTCPPSSGLTNVLQINPKHRPSSDDGKYEGLQFASIDGNKFMQCTSTPAAVIILGILERAIRTQRRIVDTKDKFVVAAKYLMVARDRLNYGDVPPNLGTNERFFTGAMANAINSVLQDGYCVLHQACLGVGTTHSDLSAISVGSNDDNDPWPTTLMVGEGKWNANNLRKETRGQIFNQLLRHRAIDKVNDNSKHGPILLVAFDKNMVEIDLAFPSKKRGKLESDGVVEFSENIEADTETFWTVRILRINIGGPGSQEHLAAVFRFLADALKQLNSWRKHPRVQMKMPKMPKRTAEQNYVEYPGETVDATEQDLVVYLGENVTIIDKKGGARFVYKEYSYHLREASDIMIPMVEIEEADKRRPPPEDLLTSLGPPYSDWKVRNGPFGSSVLCYPFIEGNSSSPSVAGWSQILRQIKAMHKIGFVHGDLLPRNVIFTEGGCGYVIDFDLSRKVGAGGIYVQGYNYVDFEYFRHNDARAGKPMAKDHDLHSLRKMSLFFFDLHDSDVTTLNLDGLIDFFTDANEISPKVPFSETTNNASGYPLR